MSKVITNVWVTKDGYPVLLRAGDTVPDGVTVTNPAALDESEADTDEADTDEAEAEADEDVEDEDDLAVVVTSDGVEHVGVLPASAATEKDVPDEAPAPRKRAPRKAAASE